MLLGAGVLLVIEIMEQSRDTPDLGIRALLQGVGPHGRFDGQGMLPEVLALRVLRQEEPGLFSAGSSSP